MRATLLLAFVAVANATFFDDAVSGYDTLAPISPLMARAMFHKFGLAKPALDANFITFGRSMGASDPTIGHMHALYDEPAVMFFMDPTGGIVSYYADAGIDSAILSPQGRAVFPSVLGAADSMAIAYQPETFLGSYKSVLPGHFFMPTQGAMLAKVMRAGIGAFPLPVEHAILKKAEIADIFPDVSPIAARFDIDEFPSAFKSPVALSLWNTDSSVAFPSSALFAKSAFPGFGVSRLHPVFAKSAYPLGVSALSSAPAFFKSSSPFIRSEIPAFHSGSIQALKFPSLVKHFAPFEPLVFAKPSFKVLPSSIAAVAPIASTPIGAAAIGATPIAATSAFEPASPELRGFPLGFPSSYAVGASPIAAASIAAGPAWEAVSPVASGLRGFPLGLSSSYANSASPIAAGPAWEAVSPVSSGLRGFPFALRGFPGSHAVGASPIGVAPLAVGSAFEPASPELRGFPLGLQSFSSAHPGFPALRFATPFSPIGSAGPVVAGVPAWKAVPSVFNVAGLGGDSVSVF